MGPIQELNAITVLTTAERIDFFRHACGEGAHYFIDPRRTVPLGDFLGNLAISGGGTVVLDEDHFIHEEDLRSGLRVFLNNPVLARHSLRVVVVCSHRRPPDELLHFLAAYCAVYDVLFDVEGAALSMALSRLLAAPQRRTDVLKLLEPPKRGAQPEEPIADERSLSLDLEGPCVLDIRIRIASPAALQQMAMEA